MVRSVYGPVRARLRMFAAATLLCVPACGIVELSYLKADFVGERWKSRALIDQYYE